MKPFSSLLALLLFAASLAGQTTENRVALVVGNANYSNNPLVNPVNDAQSVAAALRAAGFEVTEKYNLVEDSLNTQISDFSYSFNNPNTVALFYYAGHGIQYNGKNYLVPIGADNMEEETEAEWRCVPLERIASKMQDAGNRLNIIILDACRSFRLPRVTRTIQNGLVEYREKLPESLIVYSTSPGHVADDRSGTKNGLFTENLLKHLRTPGLEARDMFLKVQKEVEESSKGRQIPNVEGTPAYKFYFFEEVKPTANNTITVSPDRDKDGLTDAADRCPDAAGPQFLQGCPDGDNDGVIDMLDHCPQVFGSVANQGCPNEKPGLKKPSGWENCVGVGYSTFTSDANGGLTTIRCHAIQLNYFLINQIGGYISLGAYTGQSSGDYNISIYKAGSIGAGTRFLNLTSGFRAYIFAGAMYFHNNSDSDVFDGVKNFYGYEVFLVGNLRDAGLKAGFVSGINKGKGFSAGLHYCF